MKKLPFLLLILFACNNIDPEPSDNTLEVVSVEGGQNHSIQDSVGLLIVTRNLPPTNNWKMVWEVNGQDVFSQNISGKSGKVTSLKKYKGSQPGQYIFKGCIVSKTMRICNETTFFLR